jgi:hypothetical protein
MGNHINEQHYFGMWRYVVRCIGINILDECMASIIFDPHDGGSIFFQNIGICLLSNTASPPNKTTKLVLYSSSGVP